MTRKIFRISGFLVVYSVLVYICGTYNNYPIGDWKSELYGDKGGYYIYLPATFIHGYYEKDYPEDINKQFGMGFRFEDGKLFTKYSCGTALLITPFFLGGHLFAVAGKGPPDGFSRDYYRMTHFASVFYFLIGWLFLYLFLKRRHKWWIALMTIVLIMFGTNTFYYAFRDPVMSHIYSFALFALIIYLTDNLWRAPSRGRLFMVMMVAGLIILVRPSNIFYLLIILFLGLSSRNELRSRVMFLLRPLNLAGSVLIVFLIFLPQMIYWKFLSGSYLHYTYQEEGFTYWNNPQVLKVMLSPLNGLLTYSPAYFFILPGVIIMMIRKETDRWLVPFIFLVILYMTSSWCAYHFGCSFGQRSFVEYLALFSLPLASLIKWGLRSRFPVPAVLMSMIIIYLIYVNISLSGIYNKCYFGEDWEWRPYKMYFKKANIIPFNCQKKVFTWFDNFESPDQEFSSRFHTLPFHGAYSGENISMVTLEGKYSDTFSAGLSNLFLRNIRDVEVSLKCYYPAEISKTLIVCSIENSDEMLLYKTFRIDDRPGVVPGTWLDIQTTFALGGMPPEGLLKVYVWLLEGTELYVDDMKVRIIPSEE